MLSIRKCIVAGAIAALFGTAQAQEHAGPCKDDVAKLCKDVEPGQGKILSCLKEHQADVSPGCKTHIKNVQQQLKAVSDACEPDIEKFCWETPMGKGGIAKCLKAHQAELSENCKSAVAKAKASKKSKQKPAM